MQKSDYAGIDHLPASFPVNRIPQLDWVSDRLRPPRMAEGRATQDAVAEMAEVQIMQEQSSASVFPSVSV